MKPILIVSGTRDHKQTNTMLSQSLTRLKSYSTKFKKQYKLKVHTNNTTPLSTLYNKYLTQEIADTHGVVLFVHDDVYIDDVGCFDKIRAAIDSGIDIVGLAGANQARIKAPSLWHLMSDREHWSGSVAHTMPNNPDMLLTTCFGPAPQRCLMLDGLFLAVNIERAIEKDWRFNEEFQFHHYDLSSCLDANAKKLKLSTWNINVVHRSLGLWDYNGESFQSSERKFLQLYAG